MASRAEQLAKLAAASDCVATLDQLLELGYSEKEIRTAMARKVWQQLQRGVYLLSAGTPTWRQRALAAVLAAGGGAQLAARALAAWVGLDGATEGVIEIVVEYGKGPAPKGVAVRRTRKPSKTRTYDGRMRGTSIERLLVDYAARVPVELAERATESALLKGLTAERRIWQELATLGEAVPGVRRLARIMELRPEGKAARSTLELDALRLIRNSELPMPVRNFDVWVDGRRYEIDLAYLSRLGAIEVDSKRWHSTAAQRAKDRRKQEACERAGWTFLRITSVDVYGRPNWVIDQLRSLVCGVAAA
ncbi:MAG TPA: hypothetical protein VMZ22_12185 [Acidimicrobiales bacterium]|nr:hypothetical protein [Acidimicrobiales bacterium]